MPHNNHNNAASNNCFIKRKIREKQRTMVRRCQTEFHMRVEHGEQGVEVGAAQRMLFYAYDILPSKSYKAKEANKKKDNFFSYYPLPLPS